MQTLSRILFFLLALFALSPWGSPPLSLLFGLILALTFGNPYAKQSKSASKLLLQAAVVGLGFGLDLNTVLKVGADGFVFTLITITCTLLLGALLGKLLQIERKSRILISVGTAICGGSAIAAVGPVIQASEEEMSVSLGTVFILNSIALFIFPLIGHALAMTEAQFGLWAAIAIHDTSSVVGAAATYGKHALEIATTVKLTRALWILPVSLLFAWLERRYAIRTNTEPTTKPKIQIPWFIGLFLLASVARSLLHGFESEMNGIVMIAQKLLSLTLFLIGAGLSRAVLKRVGVRPLIVGVLLWLIVGISTLVAVWNF